MIFHCGQYGVDFIPKFHLITAITIRHTVEEMATGRPRRNCSAKKRRNAALISTRSLRNGHQSTGKHFFNKVHVSNSGFMSKAIL